MDELDWLLNDCELAVFGGLSSISGKVNVLMQTYLSRGFINNFSMVSDVAYIAQVCFIILVIFCVLKRIYIFLECCANL